MEQKQKQDVSEIAVFATPNKQQLKPLTTSGEFGHGCF